MDDASQVVDDAHLIVAAIAQVDVDVGLVAGGVGLELAEGFLAGGFGDAEDGQFGCCAGVEGCVVGIEEEGDVGGGHCWCAVPG